MTTFVQLHLLHAVPPHLPNRDRQGLAKRAYLGGVERQRISSQCAKHTLRHATDLVRTDEGGTLVPDTLRALADELGIGVSVRSAIIGERRLAPRLEQAGLQPEQAAGWSEALMALWRKAGAAAAEGGEAGEAVERGAAPLVVGEREIDLLVDVVAACTREGVAPADLRPLFEKPTALRKAPEALQQAVEALRAGRRHAGLDGALFGRFATGVAVSTVDRAVTVGELVSTHPIRSIPDFFSATDDLKTGRGDDRGGSHIGTRELTEGLFYQHVVVDVEQIERNTGCDRGQAAEIVAWLGRALYQSGPLGARRAASRAVEMMVEVGPRQPRTLAEAFAEPVDTASGARRRLRETAEESDALGGHPGWRAWLHDHLDGERPAYEAMMAAVARQVRDA